MGERAIEDDAAQDSVSPNRAAPHDYQSVYRSTETKARNATQPVDKKKISLRQSGLDFRLLGLLTGNNFDKISRMQGTYFRVRCASV